MPKGTGQVTLKMELVLAQLAPSLDFNPVALNFPAELQFLCTPFRLLRICLIMEILLLVIIFYRCSPDPLAGEGSAWQRRPDQANCWVCWECIACKLLSSQGSHPQADTDKLQKKITGCVKATCLNMSRCGFHCALASLGGLRVPAGLFASFCKVSIFGEAWGGACRVQPQEKQGGGSSQPLCRAPASPGSVPPAAQRGRARPSFAFVSWARFLGYLNAKASSNSSCVLAQDFGKLTELKGKTVFVM